MIKSDQYVKDFDYVAYNQAVKLRVNAEKFKIPMLFERAADAFTALGMFTAAEGCKARAQYYRMEVKR